MKKYFLIFCLLSLFFLLGVGGRILTNYFTVDYLYQRYIKQDFAVNPEAEIDPGQEYELEIWYYPFFALFPWLEDNFAEDFWQDTFEVISEKYPNINLHFRKLNYQSGEEKFWTAVEEGNPPDIYINPGGDSFLDRKLQIPLKDYLSKEEKNFFQENNLLYRDHQIWGLPYFFHRQKWIAGNNYQNLVSDNDFLSRVAGLPESSLALNYQNEVLLRQLLSLEGLDYFYLEKEQLNREIYQRLVSVFQNLHNWREKGLFAVGTIDLDERFLEILIARQKSGVVGPVNLALLRLLEERYENRFLTVEVGDLAYKPVINVFRQQDYRGDDHSRAAVETARIICSLLARSSEKKLGVIPGYGAELPEEIPEPIMEVDPDAREYWENDLKSAWLDFWEQGLTPEEINSRLKPGKNKKE
ncbi:MAG: hypothetical protein ACOC2G_00165 [Bacillota bacterium]